MGFGIHGIVFVAKGQNKPGRWAMKIHHEREPFERERNIYRRLSELRISEVEGFHVPQLLAVDDEWLVIEMTIVTRPFVLDFAGAYLDWKPDFSESILIEWESEKREQFGDRWPTVRRILDVLRRDGIHLLDVSPSNVAFPE